MSSAGVGPLVGRVRELRDLHDAFEDATRGRGGVELVLGEPGIGKTRLAAALAEHAAQRGARVIWTRAQGVGAPAYRPWVEVVRGLTDDLDGETLRDELGPAADELLRLVPRLAARLPEARRPARDDDDSRAARFALFDALVALLRVRSARTPVVVLIDDLHAVDEGSLVALDFVSRMLRDAAVLIVVTMHERVPDRAPEATAALQNIVRAGRRVLLGGLGREDIGRLIEQTSGIRPPPALVQSVHAATEGNPLLRPRGARPAGRRGPSRRSARRAAAARQRARDDPAPPRTARRRPRRDARAGGDRRPYVHPRGARARLPARSRLRRRRARRGRLGGPRRGRPRHARPVPLRAWPRARHAVLRDGRRAAQARPPGGRRGARGGLPRGDRSAPARARPPFPLRRDVRRPRQGRRLRRARRSARARHARLRAGRRSLHARARGARADRSPTSRAGPACCSGSAPRSRAPVGLPRGRRTRPRSPPRARSGPTTSSRAPRSASPRSR